MARKKIPGYRLHRASGQAVVTIHGRDIYLGVHGTEASRREYDRVILDHLASGGAPVPVPGRHVTVQEALAPYLAQAARKHGERSSQYRRVRTCLAEVRRLYGDRPVAEFRGPALKSVRASLATRGHNRRHLNQLVDCIKLAFRWLLSEDLAPGEAVQSVLAVESLREGEIEGVPEAKDVQPVALEVVEQTLAHLHEPLATMVRVQLCTGCRPGEVVRLCGEWMDRRHPDLWIWKPEKHKTTWRNQLRQVWLGPRALELVRPYDRPEGPYWPSPRRPGQPYTSEAYTRAVRRVVLAHQLPEWHPHQIRHTVGTEIRRRYGIEEARLYLGHATLDATEIYAQEDLDRLARVERAYG